MYHNFDRSQNLEEYKEKHSNIMEQELITSLGIFVLLFIKSSSFIIRLKTSWYFHLIREKGRAIVTRL